MKRFNDQSIRTRLTIAFSIMSAMAIVLGLVGMLMEQSQTKTITMIVLVVFAATASTALGRVISTSVYVPIRKLTEAAGRLAAGDTNVTISISTKDEIGKLAAAFHKLHSALNGLLSDTAILSEAAVNGDYSIRADETGHDGGYRLLIETVNGILDTIVTPLHEFSLVMKNISNNDFTVGVTGQYTGSPKEMADSINVTLGQMKIIARGMVEISQGNYSLLPAFESVGKRCDNDQLTPAAIMLMKNIGSLVDEANMLSRAVVAGNLDVRGDTKKFKGRYIEMIDGMNGIMDAMASPLNEAMGVLGSMAQNDLTNGMTGQYEGAFADLSQSINTVIETLNQTLSDINTSSEQVAAGTLQVSAGSQALSQGATEQASAIEQLTASLSEIAAQTRQNAINAGQASELSHESRDSAAAGNTQMGDLQRAMTEINESSVNISKIIKVIDEIAFQTNLLALNAAVEAARAGQHGKGFAVVAEEVRNLAQRSANAAKETTEMIEGSIKKVKAGTKIANDTASALVRIMGGVEKATELVAGIAAASNNQAMAVTQVNTGIEQVSQVTQTNSATAEESAAASEELSSQASMLKDMVGRFSLKVHQLPAKQGAAFQSPKHTRALGAGQPSGKPQISLNDKEFGKY